MDISDINTELKATYIAIIDPIDTLSGEMSNKKLKSKNDYNLISKMNDEEKLKLRNKLHSTHPIAQAIIDDNDELLLQLISRNNYEINEEIPSSIFEFYKELHHANPLQYAAFLGSIHCFKLLLLKSENIEYEKLYEFAIIGGNYDIIHLIENRCKTESITSNHNLLNLSILYFRNELIEYLINNYDIPITIDNYINCIYASNYEALLLLKQLNEIDSATITNEKDSNKIYHNYLNFMISIPSIIGIEYDYSWKEMIINSALNRKRFNFIGYIFKNKILNQNDECDNIKIALIIAFQYHYKEIISIFKDKSNIEDLIPSNDYEYEYEYDDINENQIIDYWDDWKNWDLYEEWDYQQYWHYYFQETDNWKEGD